MELAILALCNDGSLADLKALSGIGPKKAAQILEYRKTGGAPFQCLEDLVAKVGVRKDAVRKMLQG